MKIVFFTGLANVRHFTSVLDELFRRGHEVTLIHEYPFEGGDSEGEPVKRQGLTFRTLDLGLRDRWIAVANSLRWTRNRIYFLDKRYDAQKYLRDRFAYYSDDFFEGSLQNEKPFTRAQLNRWMGRLDEALPAPRNVVEVLKELKPDLVMVTPLIFNTHVHQYDYLKAARALGIPVCFPVFSWDNLTTKGPVLALPDYVLVWNETQRRELIDIHRVPENLIGVTGSYRFDEFLELKPSMGREEYLRNLGLDPSQKTFVYIGSSSLCAPKEGIFCQEWIKAVRGSRLAEVRNANLIIRPHPKNSDTFVGIAGPGIALTIPETMIDEDLQDLYDTLTYCEAVVGINTSAMLEAAVLRRPVLSVYTELTRVWHLRTLHFEYLVKACGGLLHMANSLEEHLEHLRTKGPGDLKSKRFTEEFLGLGKEKSPTLRFVDAVEAFVASWRRTPLAPKPVGKQLADLGLRLLLDARLIPIRRVRVGKGIDKKLKKERQERNLSKSSEVRASIATKSVTTPS